MKKQEILDKKHPAYHTIFVEVTTRGGQMRQSRSQVLWERSKKLLAGGVSSNVRASTQMPLYFERAEGSRLFDVDGNTYLDYVLGQGLMILGHTPAPVIRSVQQAIQRGQLYAGQHKLEILSEKLRTQY